MSDHEQEVADERRFMNRLLAMRRAKALPASAWFDLAASDELSDEHLDEIVEMFASPLG